MQRMKPGHVTQPHCNLSQSRAIRVGTIIDKNYHRVGVPSEMPRSGGVMDSASYSTLGFHHEGQSKSRNLKSRPAWLDKH